MLYLGDCLDPVTGLASLSDFSVDVAITDPPYSNHVHEAQRRGDARAVSRKRELGFSAITSGQAQRVAEQLARVVRRWVVVFSDSEGRPLWEWALRRAGMEHVRVGIWVKTGAPPQFTGDRPAVGHEELEIAHRAGVTKWWSGGGRHAVWTFPIVPGGKGRLHTAQKPLELLEALVRDFTDPGELVLDPFAGAGTTGAACKRLGRRHVGWELDPSAHAVAEARIAAAREQLALFGDRRVPPPLPPSGELPLASGVPEP